MKIAIPSGENLKLFRRFRSVINGEFRMLARADFKHLDIMDLFQFFIKCFLKLIHLERDIRKRLLLHRAFDDRLFLLIGQRAYIDIHAFHLENNKISAAASHDRERDAAKRFKIYHLRMKITPLLRTHQSRPHRPHPRKPHQRQTHRCRRCRPHHLRYPYPFRRGYLPHQPQPAPDAIPRPEH